VGLGEDGEGVTWDNQDESGESYPGCAHLNAKYVFQSFTTA
jgi:hypothetical protein